MRAFRVISPISWRSAATLSTRVSARSAPRRLSLLTALPRRFYASGSTQTAPQRTRSTLGPDATNPTKISQPAFTRAGQLLRVDVSASAAQKLKAISAEDKRPDLFLRIHVESGGCHGFQYVFQLQDTPAIGKSDSIFERDGARVVIDHKSLKILRDSTVDYTTELIGSQFKVVSPHTSSSCGCGTSFSLDMED